MLPRVLTILESDPALPPDDPGPQHHHLLGRTMTGDILTHGVDSLPGGDNLLRGVDNWTQLDQEMARIFRWPRPSRKPSRPLWRNK